MVKWSNRDSQYSIFSKSQGMGHILSLNREDQELNVTDAGLLSLFTKQHWGEIWALGIGERVRALELTSCIPGASKKGVQFTGTWVN